MIRYASYIEPEPTLAGYRHDHCPRDDLALVFVCPFVVATGSSGTMYQLMRGFQGRERGGVINYGIYELDGKLDHQGPFKIGYGEVPVHEPYWTAAGDDAVVYEGKHFRLDFRLDRYGWMDASGRVQLEASRLGQVSTWWIPVQPGFDVPQMLRSHMGRIRGTIDDEPVDGLYMVDFIYSRPDVMWNEMGMLTKVHNVWLNWLVEYEDGTYEGGYAWRGRPGSGFAAAHHVVDGCSTGRSDAVITLEHTERGSVSTVHLQLGDEVTVDFAQDGSCDWPLHTCGRAVSTSRGKPIRDSWNYTEYFPLNWGDLYDYMTAYEKLYGKPASFRRLMEGGRIDSEQRLVYS